MDVKIYEINKGIKETSYDDFHNQADDDSSIYVYDIKTQSREEAARELEKLKLNKEIQENILNPSEHIRFNFIGDIAYGELTYFAPKSKELIKYLGVIHTKNTLILIYDEEEEIFKDILNTTNTAIENTSEKLQVIQVLYILMLEMISSQGKLILSYRDEIEDISKELDHKNTQVIVPDDLLESKSHLSDFSRVLEKLHFSLSFPPAINILNQTSPYKIYFQELLKNIQLLELSLSQAEKRLNSLHDHYDLLLQDRSNKRLNFLTIIQAIFVPLTLLAGIYGMNFQYMPELSLKYGYFFSLAAMVIIALVFLRYFYKHGWFD